MKNLCGIILAVVVSLVFVENAFSANVKFGGKEYRLERMISQYYTIFNPANKARTANILKARKSVNFLVIKPKQVISFNELVGPRTKEAGFVEAGSYVNGKKTTSIGGGICQVSSTWCAATIKLNLKLIERHRHSLPVSYISAEQEATVAYGFKDFRFQNTSNMTLLVKCFTIENKLYVEYWKCQEV